MKKTIFLLLIMLAFSQTVFSQTRIINGSVVQSSDAKWKAIVALGGDADVSNDAQFCGGTLIDKEWVLTAAHCLTDKGTADTFIYYGTYRLETGYGSSSSVVQLISHPAYNSGNDDNDIALLKLSQPISGIAPINIRTADPVTGVTTWVAGWGNMSTESEDYPVNLMEADLPVVEFATCDNAYTNIPHPEGYESHPLTNNMFCAGYMQSTKDSCQGDSGGSLIIENSSSTYELAGVVSWGFNCADDNYPGVYAKVNNYISWIENYVSLNNNDGDKVIIPIINYLLL